MKLSQIATRLGTDRARLFGNADPDVTGIAIHSKRVHEGDIFAAIPGSRTDGLAYAQEAARRGAVAILAEREIPGIELPALIVPSARTAAADAAAAVFRDPARSMTAIGVTGTNGKTTTTSLLRWILEKDRRPCGLIGTLGFSGGGRELPTENTTPDAVTLQRHLRFLLDSGIPYCVMEVSSHALEQDRTRGIRFETAVFTNLSSEHLDFHGTMEKYQRAKRRLFVDLDARATAVGNAEDPVTAAMLSGIRAKPMLFGIDGASFPSGAPHVLGRILRADLDGVEFLLRAPGVERRVRSPLLGHHNVQNTLAAAAAALAVGVSPDAIVEGIETVGLVPGRLERVDGGKPFRVFVDYAHTDDALHRVLAMLRPYVRGRIITVFGCGGDRDRSKRPRMGAVAHALSDRVVVTSDNPRSESPEAIARDVLSGMSGATNGVTIELDRRRAIHQAIRLARSGDAVLIAGKGHERQQIIGTELHPFDDREVAREALGASL